MGFAFPIPRSKPWRIGSAGGDVRTRQNCQPKTVSNGAQRTPRSRSARRSGSMSAKGPEVSSAAEVVAEDRLPAGTAPAAVEQAELPVTVIEPTRGWQVVNVREIWR